MADKDEKTNVTAPDPQAAAVEPVTPKDPEDITFAIDIDRADEKDEDSDNDEKKVRHELKSTKSYATDASVATTTATRRQPESKPWYKTPNPLKWGGIPPVPDEKIVSREYKAGFFSLLTFQWMAPLMSVSEPSWAVVGMRGVELSNLGLEFHTSSC